MSIVRNPRSLLVVAATSLVLFTGGGMGPAAADGGPMAPTAPVAPVAAAPSAGAPVVVTEADNGRTVALARGQRLLVRLASDTEFEPWSVPDSSAPRKLRRSGASISSDGGVEAELIARAPGRALVTASRLPRCSGPCPAVAGYFELRVVVRG